jgi:RNA-directed DNA polymerase
LDPEQRGQAIGAAQRHVQSGARWVVDMDLEKFLNRGNHNVFMARVMRSQRPAHAGADPRLP